MARTRDYSVDFSIEDFSIETGRFLVPVIGARPGVGLFQDINGDGNDNTLNSTPNNDTIHGLGGNDLIYAGGGTDSAFGDGGNDNIVATAGINSLFGGAGDDDLSWSAISTDLNTGIDNAFGGGGTDTLRLFFYNVTHPTTGGVLQKAKVDISQGGMGTVKVDEFQVVQFNDIERLVFVGANGEDVAIGGKHADNLEGKDGGDRLEGGGGDDFLYGGTSVFDGRDRLEGGGGDDFIVGGLSADTMDGGAGADTFQYGGIADSTGTHFDTILSFNASEDKIQLPVPGTPATDPAVDHGTLNEQKFNKGLQNAIGAAQLAPHHKVYFTPDAGDFAGKTFLIIDDNNIAGYQKDEDYVIRLVAPNLGGSSIDDFI